MNKWQGKTWLYMWCEFSSFKSVNKLDYDPTRETLFGNHDRATPWREYQVFN